MIAERPATTIRQAEIINYIRYFAQLRGFAPTVREIGDGVGLLSSSTVQNHLKVLARKGYLVHDANRARTIRLIDNAIEETAVPVEPSKPTLGSPYSDDALKARLRELRTA